MSVFLLAYAVVFAAIAVQDWRGERREREQ